MGDSGSFVGNVREREPGIVSGLMGDRGSSILQCSIEPIIISGLMGDRGSFTRSKSSREWSTARTFATHDGYVPQLRLQRGEWRERRGQRVESGERRAESRESGESVAPPDFDLPHPSRHPPPSSLLPPLWNLPVYFHFLSLCYLPRCRLRRAMPTPLQPWIHHKAWRATKGRTTLSFYLHFISLVGL